jgi:hypothetical protein
VDIRADLLAVVVPSVGDDFEVKLVPEVAAVLFEQVGDDVNAADGFEDGLMLLDLFGHGPQNKGSETMASEMNERPAKRVGIIAPGKNAVNLKPSTVNCDEINAAFFLSRLTVHGLRHFWEPAAWRGV